MALPISADSSLKSLDTRIAALEKKIQSTDTTLTFCVGKSKITISQNEIRIETQGTLTIRAGSSLEQRCEGSMTVKAGTTLSLQATTGATLAAGGVLNLKGAAINQN